jgi:hypothetical protein
MYYNYAVIDNLCKYTPIVKPYYRLMTITEPGLKISKYIKINKKKFFFVKKKRIYIY